MSEMSLPPVLEGLVKKVAVFDFPVIRYWLIELPRMLRGTSSQGPVPDPKEDREERERITLAAQIIQDDYHQVSKEESKVDQKE